MKKTFKRILSSLMVAVIILTAAPLSGFVGLKLPDFDAIFSTKADAATYVVRDIIDSGSCGADSDNVKWTLYDDGELVISGNGAMADYGWSSPITGSSVKSSIKSVTIKDGVKSIGNYAFHTCTCLESVTIPNSVTSIGMSAFSGCTNIENLYYLGTVEDWLMINFTYYSHPILNGSNPMECAQNVFFNGEIIKELVIPDSVYYIGYAQFAGLKSVEKVVVSQGVKEIELLAFSGCKSIESVTVDSNVNLSIEDGAFNDCTSLESVTIGSNVTSISDEAFNGCTSLKDITVDANNKHYSSDSYGVLFNKNTKKLLMYPSGNTRTSYTIPDGVTSICNYAFSHCTSLTSVTIPNSVTRIGCGAFGACTNLENVYYTGNIESWCNINFGNEFANPSCSAKKIYISGVASVNIFIPDTITYINDYTFCYWKSLKSVVIPDTVTSIGDYAFYNCESLTSITIPNSVTSIGRYAFSGCTSLESVTIPDSVTSINWYAFSGCTSLESVTIPDGVTSINYGGFSGCESLKSVTIPDSVTSINWYAFSGCTSLESVTIPDSVTGIGQYAFNKCTSLESVTIGKNVTTISDFMFWYCTSLKSITIPDSVTTIYSSAFGGCTSLTDVYYGGSEEDWNNISFDSSSTYLKNATIHYNSNNYQSSDDIPNDRTAHSGTLNNYVKTVDGLKTVVSEVIINNTSYPVSKDTIEYYELDRYLNKEVAFVIKNGEVVFITEIPDISELISFAISTEDDVGYSFYGDNKFSTDSIKLKISIYNKLQTYSILPPGKDVDEYKKNLAVLKTLDCLNIDPVEVQLSSKSSIFNFNGKSSVHIPINKILCSGESFETEVVANLNKNTDLNSHRTGVEFSGALTCNLNGANYVKFDDCSVMITNYNYSSYSPSFSGGTGNQSGTTGGSTANKDPLAKKAASELKKVQKKSSNGAISLAGSPDLIELIGSDKLDAIGAKMLSVMALSTAPEDSFKDIDVLSDKVIETLFGTKKWFQIWNNKVSFDVVVDTDDYGEIKICFTSESPVYNFNGKDLGSLGQISYEITGGKGKKSLEKSGFPMRGFAGGFSNYDLDSFCDAAISFVLDELKKSYDTAYGNNLDKAADFIFGDSVNRILSYTDFGSVSGVYWELITFPGKSFKIECPVNIYVYDSNDNLVASIEDNQETLSNENIYIEINGDTKYIKLPNDSYKFVYVATAKGDLRVTVDEMANDSTSLRTIVIDDIPLVAGAIYTQNSNGKIAEDADYSLVDYSGTVYSADSDQLNYHTHSSNGVYVDCSEATCTEYGLKYSLCTVCKRWYCVQKETVAHKDTNHDRHCDVCSLEMTVPDNKVHSVSIDDISMSYKDGATLTPSINADSGVKYSVTYSSSNTDVVSVDSNGRLTTNGTGDATITVTVTDEYGNTVTDTCDVNVSYKWWQWIIVIVLFGWLWY